MKNKVLEMRNPPPPPRQEPRVIKEGEQPKKPTLDEIGDRIRMSKNYRIAEKDGFWIEKLIFEYRKTFFNLIPVREKWESIDNVIYRTYEQCNQRLCMIIDSEVENSETKYHYL
jgi:hypothetical protein